MATNLTRDEELRGLLSDIARRRFTSSRQINPQSNLFLTAQYADDQHYIEGAKFDSTFNANLSELNLTNAKLTPAGQKKLADLVSSKAKDN